MSLRWGDAPKQSKKKRIKSKKYPPAIDGSLLITTCGCRVHTVDLDPLGMSRHSWPADQYNLDREEWDGAMRWFKEKDLRACEVQASKDSLALHDSGRYFHVDFVDNPAQWRRYRSVMPSIVECIDAKGTLDRRVLRVFLSRKLRHNAVILERNTIKAREEGIETLFSGLEGSPEIALNVKWLFDAPKDGNFRVCKKHWPPRIRIDSGNQIAVIAGLDT